MTVKTRLIRLFGRLPPMKLFRCLLLLPFRAVATLVLSFLVASSSAYDYPRALVGLV